MQKTPFMNITIKLFATLRKYSSDTTTGTSVLTLKEGMSVQEVLEQLHLPPDIPKIILVNGLQRSSADVLEDGDILSVFPPIAGGSSCGVTAALPAGICGLRL